MNDFNIRYEDKDAVMKAAKDLSLQEAFKETRLHVLHSRSQEQPDLPFIITEEEDPFIRTWETYYGYYLRGKFYRHRRE